MLIITEEENNNSSLIASLQSPIPPVPIKTTPITSLNVITPAHNIAAAAVGTLAATFLDHSTKVQLNSILNRKWKSLIYSSDNISLEGRYNVSDLPNEHISALVSAFHNSSDTTLDNPKSELDSHTNMIVLGKHSFVFEWSGKSCTVNPSNDCLWYVKGVPIIDSAIAYECPYYHECYIRLLWNALYLPNMEDNLIPLFIMQASRATVNNTPKIHCTDPTSNDHYKFFDKSELNIPLHINGTFYFFPTRRPTDNEPYLCEKIFNNPDCKHWNTYCTSYELNERSILN